jgi:hypothetical protein
MEHLHSQRHGQSSNILWILNRRSTLSLSFCIARSQASFTERKMAEASPPQRVEKSSYHHFIPQFILRNFGHEYQPSSKSDKKRKAKRRIYPGDTLVKGIRLTGPNVALVDTNVAKAFGVQDLYADAGHSTDKEHIEKLLSKLEDNASRIIAKVRSSHEVETN